MPFARRKALVMTAWGGGAAITDSRSGPSFPHRTSFRHRTSAPFNAAATPLRRL